MTGWHSMRSRIYLAWLVAFWALLNLVGCTAEPAGPVAEMTPVTLPTQTQIADRVASGSLVTESPPPATSTTVPTANQTNTPAPTHTLEPSETAAPSATLAPSATPTAILVPPLERTLSRQSPALQGEDVRLLQEWLQALGYEAGVPDGIFGNMTDQAVRRYQQDEGLVQDGIVGQETWQRLFIQASTPVNAAGGGTPTPSAGQAWFEGLKGAEVKEIEARLQELGYEICMVDRNYSAQTAAAVAQFQKANGLAADGVAGPVTWEALFSANALPATQGIELRLSQIKEVGSAYEISFDGKNLWLVRKETLTKIDRNTGAGLNTISLPDVGEVEYGGTSYPLHFIARYVFFERGDLWAAGRAAPPTASGDPVVQMFTPAGRPESEPIYFGRDDTVYVKSLFGLDGKIWALLSEGMGPPAIVELNARASQAGRRVSLQGIWGVADAAPDGKEAWVVMFVDEDPTVRAVNPNVGVVGRVLGACGEEVAFDGQWVWVNKRTSLVAVDPASGEIMAHAPVNGYAQAMVSNGNGLLWVLVSRSGDTFLEVLKGW